MKKIFTTAIILCILTTGLYAQQVNYTENIYDFIENPAVFELNQEEGRAYFIPEKHISLNGKWKFLWSDVPEKIQIGRASCRERV